MKATIKKNANTVNHRETLEKQGYQVEETDTHLVVEVNNVVDDKVDLTTDEGKEKVQAAIASHNAFSYKTEWLLPGEDRAHKGIFALRKLGRLSALVMKAPAPPKPDPVNDETRAIASQLGL